MPCIPSKAREKRGREQAGEIGRLILPEDWAPTRREEDFDTKFISGEEYTLEIKTRKYRYTYSPRGRPKSLMKIREGEGTGQFKRGGGSGVSRLRHSERKRGVTFHEDKRTTVNP